MQRAEMVFMRVREHDAEEVAALLDQKADVRQDQIDAGQVLAGEGDAEIDRDPLPAALGAEAVERRDSCRSRRRRRAARRPVRRRAPPSARLAGRAADDVAGGDRLAAAVRQRQHQPSGVVDVLERARPAPASAGARAIGSPSPAARASQSARMVEKCSPAFHCASRPSILADSAANSASGVDRGAGRREIGRRIVGVGRMADAIDADADHDRSSARRSRLRPGCRRTSCPSSSRSFGHLSASCGRSAGATSATASWSASAATKASSGQCSGGAASVSSRLAKRLPGSDTQVAAAPAAPAGLPRRGDPERPALARAAQAPAPRRWSRPALRARSAARRPLTPWDRAASVSEQRLRGRARGLDQAGRDRRRTAD